MTDLDQEALDEVREIFEHFDKDGNGTIESDEFRNLLNALGAGMEDEEIAIGLDALDTNRNGRIDYDEFVAWWADR